MSITNTISKRDYLRQKFENFKRFIESKTPPDFEPNEEIERFKSMTLMKIILTTPRNRFVKCSN